MEYEGIRDEFAGVQSIFCLLPLLQKVVGDCSACFALTKQVAGDRSACFALKKKILSIIHSFIQVDRVTVLCSTSKRFRVQYDVSFEKCLKEQRRAPLARWPPPVITKQ